MKTLKYGVTFEIREVKYFKILLLSKFLQIKMILHYLMLCFEVINLTPNTIQNRYRE